MSCSLFWKTNFRTGRGRLAAPSKAEIHESVLCSHCLLDAAGLAGRVLPRAWRAPAVTPPHQVNFGASDNVIALKPALTPYHAPGGAETDGSRLVHAGAHQ